jgi:simple sugar transport system permease protein
MSLESLVQLAFWIPLLTAGVRVATPLVFAALGETVCERAGILNVGIEGMMALGAISGFLAAFATGDAWAGFAAAALTGMIAGLAFGALTVYRGADQIVTGIVFNILALGLASFAYAKLFVSARDVAQLPVVPLYRVPWLSTLPVVGRPFFAQSPVVYVAYAAIPAIWFVLERTRWGLGIRAAGENPEAVDSAGIDVWRLRLQAMTIAGGMAGVAGATLSIAQIGAYVDGMIAGRGFIALAIVVFGGWRPWRVALAALLFGLVDAFQLRLQVSGSPIPSPLLIGMPYLLTIVVVTLVASRAGYPAAINRPYPRRREARARSRDPVAEPGDPKPPQPDKPPTPGLGRPSQHREMTI